MPLLPKPYPDEMIGSVIFRGMRHNGLSLYAQTGAIYGVNKTGFPFLMCSGPRAVARLAGLDAEELVQQHTMLPYSTAFMPINVKTEMLSNAICKPHNPSSGFSRPFTFGVTFRRVCPECIESERKQFGETYWHRSHHLPGVLNCTEHGIPLRRTDIPLEVTASPSRTALPGEVLDYRLNFEVDARLLDSVTQNSIRALHTALGAAEMPWKDDGRQKAVMAGYLLSPGKVASKHLEIDFRNAYGDAYIVATGCEIQMPGAWPAVLARPNNGATLATPKHVLFKSYFDTLESSEARSSGGYQKRGPKFKDRSDEDQILAAELAQIIERASAAGCRLAIKDLLLPNVYSMFRRHRAKYPLVGAAVDKLLDSKLQSIYADGAAKNAGQ